MTLRPLLRLWPYFAARRGRVSLCVVGLMLATGLSLLGPWLIARAIDVDLHHRDWSGLVWTASFYGVAVLGNAVVAYLSRVGLQSVAQDAMRALKETLFDHLLKHDLSFHDRHPSGRLITRVQGDTEALRVLFAEVILAVPADALLVVGMFVVMMMAAPEVAGYVAWVLPPYLLLLIWFRRAAPPKFLEVRKVSAALTGFLSEALRGMTMLQRFEREAWANAKARERFEEVYRADVPATMMPVYYFNAVFMVRNLGIAGVLVFGAWRVAEGTLSLGLLMMGLGYLRLMFGPMLRLSQHMTTLERSRAAAVRIDELLEQRPTIVDASDAVAWPGLSRGFAVESVSFEYDEGTPVLRDVSMEIAAGSKVGIVGATGSGKSTLLNLLMRFRDPSAGRITVDGVDLRAIRLDALRENIGLVLQDIHLMRGTVLDNLGGDATRAAWALELVGLELSPAAELEEGARNLSRGERQLLTFARALVFDPAVLVLDEATSAVDPGTEARLVEALGALEQGRTTIMVAHRLATVRDCDVIFVLHRGVLAEHGDHATLLARGGIYAALYTLQQTEGGA